jgi:hypothetical protein
MKEANRHTDDVLTAELPTLSTDEVAGLLRKHYRIEGALRPLSGERDLNFGIDGAGGETFVFKIANAAEADLRLDFQTAALDHIAAVDPTLPVPRAVATVDGEKLISFPTRQASFARGYSLICPASWLCCPMLHPSSGAGSACWWRGSIAPWRSSIMRVPMTG